MLLNREGHFKARILEAGVSETGSNQLVTFVARFAIDQEYYPNDAQWYDVSNEGAEITGYFYLEKKDGSLNTRAIESLCEALGWDGRDVFWLQDTDLGDRLVQLTIAMETYENKTRPKVRWINHEDAEPTSGVKRADGTARTAIANRLSGKLRANAGGTPRPAPAPTSSKPKPPAPKTPAKPPAPDTPPRATTMDEAWEIFVSECPDNMSDKERERQWFHILAQMFPGKEITQLTPADWQKFAEEGPAQIVPF